MPLDGWDKNKYGGRIIVVLGMHRSGTSAITAGLNLLGVPLGDDLHPAGFDNPKGFWEDQSVIDINEELLALNNSGYDRIGLDIPNLEAGPNFNNLRRRATELTLRRLEELGGVWGFKDPRTSRTFPFWKKIFLDLGCDIACILALRNPASVISSLEKRNNTAGEKGYVLWMEHMLAALSYSEGFKRIVVDFDDFIENPITQLTRIAMALGLKKPNPSSKIARNFVDSFLDRRLVHSSFSKLQLDKDDRIPSDAIKLFEILKDASQDKFGTISKTIELTTNELQKNFLGYSPLLKYVNSIENSISNFERQVYELHLKVGERDTRIESLSADLHNLNQSVHDRDNQIQVLGKTVTERDTRIESLSADLHNLNQSVHDRDSYSRMHLLKST